MPVNAFLGTDGVTTMLITTTQTSKMGFTQYNNSIIKNIHTYIYTIIIVIKNNTYKLSYSEL